MVETFNKMEFMSKYSRYYLVNLAFEWAKYLREKKFKNKILSEIVDEAILDIMEGRITPEEIEKIMLNNNSNQETKEEVIKVEEKKSNKK